MKKVLTWIRMRWKAHFITDYCIFFLQQTRIKARVLQMWLLLIIVWEVKWPYFMVLISNFDLLLTCTQGWAINTSETKVWQRFVFFVSTDMRIICRQRKAILAGGSTTCGMADRQLMRSGEWGAQREGGETEGGREKAGVSTHHAPGISYLKFGRSAPQKPPCSASKDAHLRTRCENAHFREGSDK